MNDRQDATRARLLDATLAVLTEHGVAHATSRQISAVAGVNLQAITYHFGSKDDLVADALVDAVRRWTEPIRAVLAGIAENPIGGLFTIATALQDSLDQARDFLPAYLEALAAASRQPEIRDRIGELIDPLREDMVTALRELAAAGILADWVDPEAMAGLVVAAGNGVVLHTAVDPERFDPEATVYQVIRLLLSASTLTGLISED